MNEKDYVGGTLLYEIYDRKTISKCFIELGQRVIDRDEGMTNYKQVDNNTTR